MYNIYTNYIKVLTLQPQHATHLGDLDNCITF